MAARPSWTGHLRLSLVSFPVRLYTALQGYKTRMHQIHKDSGERIRYQLTAPGVGDVERDEVVKGYEYQKGKYVLFEPEELQELRLESKDVIELVQFTDMSEIDALYYDTPYFVVPDGAHALEPFVVIRDALKKSRQVGLGQITMSGRERIIGLKPCGRGMIAETLRYEEEVREADKFFDEIDKVEIDDEQVKMATDLIKRKTASFDPGKFQDHYEMAVRAAVEAKLAGKKPEDFSEEERHEAVVINLTDALRRSLRGGGESEAEEPASRRKTATKKAPAHKTARKAVAHKAKPRHKTSSKAAPKRAAR